MLLCISFAYGENPFEKGFSPYHIPKTSISGRGCPKRDFLDSPFKIKFLGGV